MKFNIRDLIKTDNQLKNKSPRNRYKIKYAQERYIHRYGSLPTPWSHSFKSGDIIITITNGLYDE